MAFGTGTRGRGPYVPLEGPSGIFGDARTPTRSVWRKSGEWLNLWASLNSQKSTSINTPHSRVNLPENGSGAGPPVLERAGLGHMFYLRVEGVEPPVSDEEILAEVQRVAKLVNRPFFSRNDFDAHSTITSVTCRHRFGRWQETLEARRPG